MQYRRRCGTADEKGIANDIHIAQGSLNELDTHLEMPDASNYVPDGDWKN